MTNPYVIATVVIGVGALIGVIIDAVRRRRYENTEPYNRFTPTSHPTPKCKLCDKPIQFDSKTLQCGHSFHYNCIESILEDVTESCKLCPICHTEIRWD